MRKSFILVGFFFLLGGAFAIPNPGHDALQISFGGITYTWPTNGFNDNYVLTLSNATTKTLAWAPSASGQWAPNDINIYNTNTGSVGIGTNFPKRKLHINNGNAESTLLLTNNPSGQNADDGLLIGLNSNGFDTTFWNYENGYMRFATGDSLRFLTGGSYTERMRITNTGNVGIGTNDPGENKLYVNGDTYVNGNLRGTQLCIGADCRTAWPSGGGSSQWTDGTGGIIYYKGGKVGIGTDNPQQKLDINGGAESLIRFTNNTGQSANAGLLIGLNPDENNAAVWNKGNGFIQFGTQGTERMRITSTGNVEIGTASPSPYMLNVNGDISGNRLCVAGDCKGGWDWATNGNNLFNANSGYVGIGTQTPGALLQVGEAGTGTGTIERIRLGAKQFAYWRVEATDTSDKAGLGIGYASQIPALFIQNDFSQSGNIGVGTTTPSAKLHVITRDDTTPTTVPAWDNRHFTVGANGTTGGVGISYNQTANYGVIQAVSPSVSWRNLILEPGGGNIGITKTNPNYKLDVAGSINGTELCINATCKPSWPSPSIACVIRSNGGNGANCQGGESMTGGGAICTNNDEQLWSSYPTPYNGWQAVCKKNDGSPGTVSSTYAICCTAA